MRFSLETTVLEKLSSRGLLKVVPLYGQFFDIGIPSDYDDFVRWFHENKH